MAENIALAMPGDFDLAALSDTHRPGLRGIWPAARAVGDRRRSLGRRAPAHRDRALPAAGAAAPDHGRADGGADAAGGRPAFRHAAAAGGRGLRRALHQPSARGGEAPLPQRHHPAPRQGGGQCRSAQGNGGEPGAADGRRRDSHREVRRRQDCGGVPGCGSSRLSTRPPTAPSRVALKDISLDVRGGEIVAHRRRRRQRPVGTLRRALGRAARTRDMPAIQIDGAPCGAAGRHRAPQARRRLRAGGAPGPWRRAGLHACRRMSC